MNNKGEGGWPSCCLGEASSLKVCVCVCEGDWFVCLAAPINGQKYPEIPLPSL